MLAAFGYWNRKHAQLLCWTSPTCRWTIILCSIMRSENRLAVSNRFWQRPCFLYAFFYKSIHMRWSHRRLAPPCLVLRTHILNDFDTFNPWTVNIWFWPINGLDRHCDRSWLSVLSWRKILIARQARSITTTTKRIDWPTPDVIIHRVDMVESSKSFTTFGLAKRSRWEIRWQLRWMFVLKQQLNFINLTNKRSRWNNRIEQFNTYLRILSDIAHSEVSTFAIEWRYNRKLYLIWWLIQSITMTTRLATRIGKMAEWSRGIWAHSLRWVHYLVYWSNEH